MNILSPTGSPETQLGGSGSLNSLQAIRESASEPECSVTQAPKARWLHWTTAHFMSESCHWFVNSSCKEQGACKHCDSFSKDAKVNLTRPQWRQRKGARINFYPTHINLGPDIFNQIRGKWMWQHCKGRIRLGTRTFCLDMNKILRVIY